MDVDEIKQLLKVVDELETLFAEQKAHYEARREVLYAAILRMGQEMIPQLEALPPGEIPKGASPVEGGLKELSEAY